MRQEENGGDTAIVPTEYDTNDDSTIEAFSYFQFRDEISKGRDQIQRQRRSEES